MWGATRLNGTASYCARPRQRQVQRIQNKAMLNVVIPVFFIGLLGFSGFLFDPGARPAHSPHSQKHRGLVWGGGCRPCCGEPPPTHTPAGSPVGQAALPGGQPPP